MKSQIFAFLLAVLLVTTNAFSIPSQMALGGVNGGTMHDLNIARDLDLPTTCSVLVLCYSSYMECWLANPGKL